MSLQYLSTSSHLFGTMLPMSLGSRAVCAAIIAFLVVVCSANRFIGFLQAKQAKQVVRDDGPSSHFSKQGTPTMGGLLIHGAGMLSLLVCCSWSHAVSWLVLLVWVAYAGLGFLDDYLKIAKQNTYGVSAKQKLFAQCALAAFIVYLFQSYYPEQSTFELWVPLWHASLHGSWWSILLFDTLVIVGASNAVNLTDGLDGLASFPVLLIALFFGLFAYLSYDVHLAQAYAWPLISGRAELMIPAFSLFGATLGFLWFNAYPAQCFMGDVGSLCLGALLGACAVFLRMELLFAFMGMVFVVETLSVAIQVFVYKLTKKRVFRMAPLHHHYELAGCPEPKVTVRFWIVTLAMVCLSIFVLFV